MPRGTGSSGACRGLAVLAVAALLAAPGRTVAAGRLQVSAAVDRTELARDEVLTLEVRVDAPDAPTLSLPTASLEFDVVSRSQSRQASFNVGGAGVQLKQTFVYLLGLAPRRVGTLTIPPVEVTAGGEKASTEPITVKVVAAGSRAVPPPQPQGGGSAWHGWERDLQLVVELDRREAFLGEQVTASILLLSPVGVVSYEGYKPPLYDGFWTEDVETPRDLSFQVRKVNGLPLRAYLLQRLALFPTRAGSIELGPFQIDVVVRVGSDSPFDPFPEVRRVSRRSPPTTVTVKPLPAGAPPGFDAVNVITGTLQASLSERSAQVGQPVTVRVAAQGEGNVKAWSLPALPALPGVRAFAPTSSDKVAPKGWRIAGSRAVETVLVPSQAGTVVVPPLAWPVFDPKARAYQVLRTPELRLEVLAASGASATAAAPGQNALAAGLRPIRTGGPLGRRGEPPWQGPWFWLLLAGAPAAFALLSGVDRLRERHEAGGGARRVARAGRVARRRLAQARRLAAGDEAAPFFAELERALVGYCGDKLGRSAAGLTRDELARLLTSAGAHPPAVRTLASALDACDAGRYGGSAARDEVLALAGRAMELLEEAHWHAPGSAT
jgi:hypothetical protein